MTIYHKNGTVLTDQFDSIEAAVKAGVNLMGANLTYADLTGADLTGADLSGATLTGATITLGDRTITL